MMSSHHGLYKQGYTCVTVEIIGWNDNVNWSKTEKIFVVRIVFCNLICMKLESSVIVNHQCYGEICDRILYIPPVIC